MVCVKTMSTTQTQWSQIQQLPRDAQQRVHALYGEQFPIEVRCAFAEWIENKPWKELDSDLANHDTFASKLVTELFEEIERRAQCANSDTILAIKLYEWSQYFRDHYLHAPFLLVKIVKHCLDSEFRIIQLSNNQLNILLNNNTETKHNNIHEPHHRLITEYQNIEHQRKKALQLEEELNTIQSEQETFIIAYQESEKHRIHIETLKSQHCNGQSDELLAKWKKDKESIDNALRAKANAILTTRVDTITKMEETVFALKTILDKVLNEELIKWKRAQQLSGNGIPFDNNLDQIQEWCESLAEIIWQSRQQIKRTEILCQQLPFGNASAAAIEKLGQLDKHVTSLLSNLVMSTFIVEKQPPQVMKINTKFASTLRLLVGGKLNLHMTPPQVTVKIISESYAGLLVNNEKTVISGKEICGEILNNNVTMEYQPSVRQLAVNFRNMSLKNFKRPEKRANESVMDEKFALLFQTQFKLANGELLFNVWTLSLPIAVIVHSVQEAHALATVTWDNAFAKPVRKPFEVQNKVLWSRVGHMLSEKFKSSVGNGLTDINLRFLASKALRNCGHHDFNNAYLSWTQFSKEPLPDRQFTFWEWFHAAIKVTREHLRDLWNDNSVIGFVSRKDAEDMLSAKCNGTFLLRFSEGELGGVTVAWITDSLDGTGGQETFMLQPFTSKDFQMRGLSDQLNDLKQLTFLYPDVPKEQAFGKYYTPLTETQIRTNKPNYVQQKLVNVITGFLGNGNGLLDSNPNTPQSVTHHYPQSPIGDASSHSGDGYSAQVNAHESETLMNFVNSTTDNRYANLIDIDMLCDTDAVDFD